MSSAPQKDIMIEKVSRYAIIRQQPWTYNPTKKVSELLQMYTDWRNYRLAYGVYTSKYNEPLQLKWATPLSAQYDPSCGQLFRGIHLAQGQKYYFLISQLAAGLRDISIRDHPDSYSRFQSCLSRYVDLYKPPDPTRPAAPPSLGPSAKRPPHAKSTRDCRQVNTRQTRTSVGEARRSEDA
jgi:hypothetical protein